MTSKSKVGWVTTGAYSPYLKAGIGYVRFENPGDWINQTLMLHDENGDLGQCKIVEPPFYDREKKTAKELRFAINC